MEGFIYANVTEIVPGNNLCINQIAITLKWLRKDYLGNSVGAEGKILF